MNKNLKNSLIQFYNKVDNSKSNKEIAIDYFKEFHSIFGLKYLLNRQIEKSDGNISILSQDTSLDFLTRRLTMISNSNTISHYTGVFQSYATINSNDSAVADWLMGEDPDYRVTKEKNEYQIDCPNLSVLGKWLIDCENLIKNNELIYYPRIKTYTETTPAPAYREAEQIKYEEHNPTIDCFIKNKKVVRVKNEDNLKSKFVKHILSIELPLIDRVNLDVFSKISTDEKSQIDVLRDFLKEKFIEIEENEGKENQYEKIEKLSLEIKKGVRLINTDFKILKQKKAFQVSGALLTGTVATLVAINSSVFGMIGEVIGGGSGLYLFLKILEEDKIAKTKLKNNPYYYFWFLENRI